MRRAFVRQKAVGTRWPSVFGCLLLTAFCLLTLAGCGGPPQLGDDKEVHKQVEALFTALTAQDAKLLDRAEAKLRGLKDKGKVPEPAFESLEEIIAKARAGKWESAAKDLDRFIKGQKHGKK